MNYLLGACLLLAELERPIPFTRAWSAQFLGCMLSTWNSHHASGLDHAIARPLPGSVVKGDPSSDKSVGQMLA